MIDHAVLAYVGPGPGLTMFWAFLALLGTVLLAILSLLLWPIRALIRAIRGTPPAPAPTTHAQDTTKPTDAAPDANRTTASS